MQGQTGAVTGMVFKRSELTADLTSASGQAIGLVTQTARVRASEMEVRIARVERSQRIL